MKELWLIRHGETEWNVKKRFQGHLDVPLSPVGIGQAQDLAEHYTGVGYLQRAQEAPPAAPLGLPVADEP